jgi:putative DNA-invertase from lambdoid prophage Rac
MSVYLYSRVSLEDQSVENQKIAATKAGHVIDYVFADSGISGGIEAMERPQFAKMMKMLQAGDRVVVAAADRIGRKTTDVISTVEKFVAMKVELVILAYGSMDFTSPIGMAMLSVGAAFSALERSDLRRRTSQGMVRVKAEGVMLGQPLKITPKQLSKMLEDKSRGITISQMAREHRIERSTISRNLKRWEGKMEQYQQEYVKREGQYVESKREKTQQIHAVIYDNLKGMM